MATILRCIREKMYCAKMTFNNYVSCSKKIYTIGKCRCNSTINYRVQHSWHAPNSYIKNILQQIHTPQENLLI